MTVGELRQRMSHKEYMAWAALYEIEAKEHARAMQQARGKR